MNYQIKIGRNMRNLIFFSIVFLLISLFFIFSIFVFSTSSITKTKSLFENNYYIASSSSHISEFGQEEYKCSGKCTCEEEEVGSKFNIVVSALSSIKAYNKAKKRIQNQCENNYFCDDIDFSLSSEIQNCELSSVQEYNPETIGSKKKNEENIVKEEEGDTKKKKKKYRCNGNCLFRPYPTEEDNENIGLFSRIWQEKKLSLLEGIKFYAVLRGTDCTRNELEKKVISTMNYQGIYERFLGEMVKFCREAQFVEATRKDGSIYRTPICAAYVEKYDKEVDFPKNPSIKCQRLTRMSESEEEEDPHVTLDDIVKSKRKVIPKFVE